MAAGAPEARRFRRGRGASVSPRRRRAARLALAGRVIAAAVPQRNVLAVVYDDTRSMRIRDSENSGGADSTRLAAVRATFSDSGALLRTLSERFAVRRFGFAGAAAPVRGVSDVDGRGTRSDLAQALTDVREDLSGMPLAGIVLVSDGADNGSGALDDALLALRAQRVPLATLDRLTDGAVHQGVSGLPAWAERQLGASVAPAPVDDDEGEASGDRWPAARPVDLDDMAQAAIVLADKYRESGLDFVTPIAAFDDVLRQHALPEEQLGADATYQPRAYLETWLRQRASRAPGPPGGEGVP